MAEDRNEAQERTEQATPRRQQEARDKGQVSRSRELSTMMTLLAGSGFLLLGSQSLVEKLMAIMGSGFIIERANVYDPAFLGTALSSSVIELLSGLAPLFLLLLAVSVMAPLSVGGWIFSPQALAPQWQRIDPLQGLKRVFGVRGLMELVKALAKFLLICGLAVLLLWLELDKLMQLGRNGLPQGLTDAAALIFTSFVTLSAVTVLIAMVDVPFQLWEHGKQLKMTKQELKDEMKETEGRPEVKSQLRSMQQEIANRRMLEDVPSADVVVTNPTHFAVALRYDQTRMGAPRVMAKGMDHVAERIRACADRHGVAIFSAPPLARALYFTTRIGQEIPAPLYVAVAQVLAYVFQLRESYRDPDVPVPERPEGVDVPEGLQRG